MRAAWVAQVALAAFLVVSGVSAQLADTFDFGSLGQGDPRYLGAQEAAALAQLGLSVDTYRSVYVAADIFLVVAYSVIPISLFLRKSKDWDWMAVAVSAALLIYGATLTLSFQTLLTTPSALVFPARFLNTLSTVSVPILAYLFPDGRFIPRWTRWLAAFWAVWALTSLFVPLVDPYNWPPLFLYLLDVIGLATALYAQVYRYRRVSTPEQRQQTKWVVYGFAVATGGYALLPLLSLLIPALMEAGRNRLLFGMAFLISSDLFQLAVPVAFSFAIMRYRLWDVDFLINRTAVYLIVTGATILVFEAVSTVFGRLFESVVGSDSPINLVAPGLVAAVTIQPIHHHTQEFIDRAFYREKVEAREAFLYFTHEVRQITTLPDALHLLVERVTKTLHLKWGAVYMRDKDGRFQLVDACNLAENDTNYIAEALLGRGAIERLEDGRVVSQPDSTIFSLLVPLTLPAMAKLKLPDAFGLAGILALGPRLSGQGYSKEDEALLLALADQVGTAIYMTRLAEEQTSH